MEGRVLEADIAVVGGGPAGAVAARRLAVLGYNVALAHEPRRGDRIETLPPSLTLLGHEVLAPDRLAGISEPVRRVLSGWSGESTTVRESPGACMLQRSGFDRILLLEAARAGVAVLSPARAGRAQRCAGGWIVPVVRDGTANEIKARFLIDARGRRGGKRIHAGPRTVALSALWTGAGLEPGEMRIAAHPDGWCWAASRSAGPAEITVFLDTHACAGLGRAKLQQRYLAMLAGTTLFAGVLRNGTPGPLSVSDATPSTADQPASAWHLASGDAALTIDPLSSHGVIVGCRAAIQAAAVIHTILSGDNPAPALAFYAGRLAAVGSQHALSAGALYGDHDAWRDHPFWRTRIGSADRPILATAPPSLRAVRDVPLRLSPAARTIRIPALIGDKVELCDAIAHPNLSEPIVRLGRYDVPALLARMESGRLASVLVAGLGEICSPAEAHALLDWLTHTGILEPHANADCRPASA
jgi:flavin-dependent dehydrogenase